MLIGYLTNAVKNGAVDQVKTKRCLRRKNKIVHEKVFAIRGSQPKHTAQKGAEDKICGSENNRFATMK